MVVVKNIPEPCGPPLRLGLLLALTVLTFGRGQLGLRHFHALFMADNCREAMPGAVPRTGHHGGHKCISRDFGQLIKIPAHVLSQLPGFMAYGALGSTHPQKICTANYMPSALSTSHSSIRVEATKEAGSLPLNTMSSLAQK